MSVITERIESIFTGLKITTDDTSIAVDSAYISGTKNNWKHSSEKPDKAADKSRMPLSFLEWKSSIDEHHLPAELSPALSELCERHHSLDSLPPVKHSHRDDSTHDQTSKSDSADSDTGNIFGDREGLRKSLKILADRVSVSRRLNKYCLTRLIGFGAFGVVVQALCLHSGRRLAVKIMRKSQIHHSRCCFDPQTGQTSILEIVLLKYVPEHPNIIRYIDAWDDEECWYLVCELGGYPWTAEPLDPITRMPAVLRQLFCPEALKTGSQTSNGRLKHRRSLVLSTGKLGMPAHRIIVPDRCNDHSLAGFLRICGGFSDYSATTATRVPILHEDIQRLLFEQMVEALSILHQSGIVHKDLKDENILVDADLRVRLIDFGHAAFYRSPAKREFIAPFKAYGTALFTPPEIRSGLSFIGPEADVYALGLILYEMTFGDLPINFDKARYCRNGECIFDLSDAAGFRSEKLRDLLRGMLSPDPRSRLTVEQVLAHPWLGDD